MKRLIEAWNQFFFAPFSEISVASFRIVFGLNALVMYAIRFKDWKFYFTDEGFVKTASAIEILPEFYRPAISFLPPTPTAAFTLQILFLTALFCVTLGFFSRLAAIAAFVLHLAFMQRNFSIAYGADIVNTFFLFGLMFMSSDRVWSVRAWMRRGRVVRPQSELKTWLTTMGVRLVQVQLCIIYGYTGLEKLKGPTWWDGTAVWAVLGNPQIMMFDTSWLRHFPLVIAVMTLGTVVWEVYFPVLVWVKPIRKWVLLGGLMLHAGIAIGVGLLFFSTAMCSTYLLFVNEDTLRRFARRLLPKRLAAMND